MDSKTIGIVLRCSKYSDSNYIAQILTKDFGKLSFAIYSPQSKKAKVRTSMLQPLSLLDIDFDGKPSLAIKQIKEAKLLSIKPLSVEKISVSIFVADIVCATIPEGNFDDTLFFKVLDVVNILYSDEKIDGHFALQFLLDYADALGFNPQYDSENILLSEFLGNLVEEGEKELFLKLVKAASSGDIKIFSHSERRTLLRVMLLYYQMNLPNMPSIKSLDVFEEVFF